MESIIQNNQQVKQKMLVSNKNRQLFDTDVAFQASNNGDYEADQGIFCDDTPLNGCVGNKNGKKIHKPKRDFTPPGWSPGEKRPYKPIPINRFVRKDRKLSSGAKVVMEELIEAGGGDGYAYPSMNVIAHNCPTSITFVH